MNEGNKKDQNRDNIIPKTLTSTARKIHVEIYCTLCKSSNKQIKN